MTASPPRRSGPTTRGYVVFALLAIGAVMTCQSGWSALEGVSETCSTFFRHVQAGQQDSAYALLSARRRSAMTREQFDQFIDHPAFRTFSERTAQETEVMSDFACVYGDLIVDGEEWTYQIALEENGDAWKIRSLAIQRPTSVSLGTLLEECGYWEGTRVGYSGPPIERTMPTL